jgi:ATP-binding cassette subfamily B multidrug efflux pump
MKRWLQMTSESQNRRPYDIKLMLRLWPYLRPHRFHFIGILLLVLLITGLDLTLPLITKTAIDRYIVPDKGGIAAGADQEAASRRYPIDLSDAKQAAVARRYAHLIENKEGSASIAWEDLSLLTRRDLTLLRHKDVHGVTWAAALLLAVLFANLALTFAQVINMEAVGQNIMHRLRYRLFSALQKLPLSFFDRTPVARLVTAATNDIQNMHDLFTSVVVVVMKDFFLLAGITLVLISIDLPLVLAAFSLTPLIVIVALLFSRRVRSIYREIRSLVADINTRFSETIEGIGVLQLFNRQADNYADFRKVNHASYQAEMSQIHVFALFMPVIELIGSVVLAVIIFHGGGDVLSHRISLGSLVAFISYMRMFFRPIRDLAEKFNILQNALASAERIFALMDTPTTEENKAATKAGPPAALRRIRTLALKNIFFGYNQGEMILKDISLALAEGETLALVGSTGSGKTTLISLINRLYTPLQGRLLVNGKDVRRYSVTDLRRRIAIVMQDPFLFTASVGANLFPGRRRIPSSDVQRVLEAAGCRDLVDHLPDGLQTVLSGGGKAISSGERQLLAIARALAKDPDLIILDEAWLTMQ